MRADGDAPMLTSAQIMEINRRIADSGGVHDLAAVPARLPGADVRARMHTAAQDLAGEELPALYAGGQPLTAQEWSAVRANRAADAVGDVAEAAYAVAVQRADVRLLPTGRGWFSSPGDVHNDALQGTVIDPGEAVLVLHVSRDGAFAFVMTRDYYGWVDQQRLARTNRQTWEQFAAPQDFFTVTAAGLRISDGGQNLLYQLGAKIPGRRKADGKIQLLLPARDAGGNLIVRTKDAADDGQLAEGRLPLTHNNLVRLAFLPLHTEYGWGGQNEGMDCSSYVQNIYRAMGIELPRDADEQERACMLLPLTGLSTEARMERVSEAPPGALLFRPGHVMLYLGRDAGGVPLVIHDISSYYKDGEKHYIREVVVSHLDFQNARGIAAIDTLSAVGVVIPPKAVQ